MRPTPKMVKKGLSQDRNGWKAPTAPVTGTRVDKPPARRGN